MNYSWYKKFLLQLFIVGLVFFALNCDTQLLKDDIQKQDEILLKTDNSLTNTDEEPLRIVKGAKFGLIFISDIHQGKGADGANAKPDQIQQIVNDLGDVSNNIRAVCMAGDLIDNGKDSECDAFLKDCVQPMAWLMPDEPHHGIYLCKGNHDEGEGNKDNKMLKFLRDEYGDYRYSFDIDGLHVVCCGKYPDKSLFPNLNNCCGMSNTLKWLEDDLAPIKSNRPVVLFWHFNIMGPFSDWWGISWGKWQIQKPKTVKNALFNILEKYKTNVKGIFTGHWHNSFCTMWRGKYPVIDVGGGAYAFCTYDPATQAFDIKFKDGAGSEYTWAQKEENGNVEL